MDEEQELPENVGQSQNSNGQNTSGGGSGQSGPGISHGQGMADADGGQNASGTISSGGSDAEPGGEIGHDGSGTDARQDAPTAQETQPAETLAAKRRRQIEEIKSALFSPEQTVRYSDRTVTYKSNEDMKKALDEAERDVLSDKARRRRIGVFSRGM